MNKFFEIDFLNIKPKTGNTKFGGQPDWLTKPEWPISKETGNPMRFICQIDLTEIGFGKNKSKFAYLFMTEEHEYVDGTWEADGGENAIILQPNINELKTERINQGPSLYKMVKKLFKKKLVQQQFECAVKIMKKKENAKNDNEDINFRNAGVGYGFINEKENKAKFIWQCM